MVDDVLIPSVVGDILTPSVVGDILTPSVVRHTPKVIRHTPSVVRHTPSVVRHTPLWHAAVLEGITKATISFSHRGPCGMRLLYNKSALRRRVSLGDQLPATVAQAFCKRPGIFTAKWGALRLFFLPSFRRCCCCLFVCCFGGLLCFYVVVVLVFSRG